MTTCWGPACLPDRQARSQARRASSHGIRGLRRMGDIETRYYMRVMVTDRPGVLGRIAGVLGRHEISIASVHQKERRTARVVPVVMMTHEAKEANMRRALANIDRLEFVKHPTVALRTEAPRSVISDQWSVSGDQ
jgi:UTP:GlnB (protein PII) uridylyltransferase